VKRVKNFPTYCELGWTNKIDETTPNYIRWVVQQSLQQERRSDCADIASS
jgi:hypothetical protein